MVKFDVISLTLMTSNNRITQNDNTTNATAAISMVGTIVTAALLVSGLFFISSYQPAIAQQNMTGAGNATNATMMGAGNATNATMMGAGNATNATMMGAGNATNATMMGAGNATTAGGPTAADEGEGSGGGAAGGGGTTPTQ
jgi:hypothetical protein